MATQCAQKYLTTTYQSWGAKVRAVHIAGSYWAPGFANYLLLLQVFYHTSSRQCKMQATDIFTYNMTHCPGPENTATAASLLDIIVRFAFSWFWGKLRKLLNFSLVERAADDNPTLLEVAENLWTLTTIVNIAIALPRTREEKNLLSTTEILKLVYTNPLSISVNL